MIGSHNTYTYLKSDTDIYNHNTRFWRCQDCNISKQYQMGVRYFDIRVFRTKNKYGKDVWQAAHGLVNLEKQWLSIKSICNMFKNTYKNSKFRLVLEKGDEEDEKIFKEETLENVDNCPSLISVIIKKPWTVLYNRENLIFHDYSYEEWKFTDIIQNLTNFPIKENAAKVNPTITKEMLESSNEVWFMDYVCGA